MKEFILRYPVKDLEGRQLLAAGTRFTAKNIDRLITQGRAAAHPVVSMMKHKTIAKDLHNFLNIPPYHIIFSDTTQTKNLFDLFEQVILPVPILEILDYFKEKDFHTYRHSLTVYALSTYVAKMMRNGEMNNELLTGPTHDIGMSNIPLEILTKEAPLSLEEEPILKHHVLAGYVLLCYYLQDQNNISTRLALEHHERLNGSGALGIRTENKLVDIVTACDIYDALISHRPFRPMPYQNRAALEELTAMADRGDISRDVLTALIALNREHKPAMDDVIIPLEKRETPPADNIYGNREAEQTA